MKKATLALAIALLSACGRAETVTLSSPDDFSAFTDNVKGGMSYEGTTVLLDNDIDFMHTTDLTPIGNKGGSCFQGTFDGQGYMISGLKLKNKGIGGYYGLFGYSRGATIHNLVTDSTEGFEVLSEGDSDFRFGSIIGYCEAIRAPCKIERCLN